jgi:hypothetical protein
MWGTCNSKPPGPIIMTGLSSQKEPDKWRNSVQVDCWVHPKKTFSLCFWWLSFAKKGLVTSTRDLFGKPRPKFARSPPKKQFCQWQNLKDLNCVLLLDSFVNQLLPTNEFFLLHKIFTYPKHLLLWPTLLAIPLLKLICCHMLKGLTHLW